jgi:hypothetical protein
MMLDLGGMDRRALLMRALLLAGASASLGACDMIGLAGADSPFRYSAEDMALLSAVADQFVPRGDSVGALDAGVPALFEGLMANWAAPATRQMMAGVLAAINALDPQGRDFAALPAADQAALLTAHDAAALAVDPDGRGSPFGPPPATDPAYQRFKQLVVTLYYLSEPALTQELAYTHAPGAWVPSVPVTPETRPQGGPGMF